MFTAAPWTALAVPGSFTPCSTSGRDPPRIEDVARMAGGVAVDLALNPAPINLEHHPRSTGIALAEQHVL